MDDVDGVRAPWYNPHDVASSASVEGASVCVRLSLGSNVGDRAGNLGSAIAGLRETLGVRVDKVSRCYQTEPLGITDQPAFLNLAVEIETALEPLELLNAVKDIEARLGRTPTPRWGPRAIDIDIILWGSLAMETERLTIPHPEFRKRAFVLAPLAEIASDAVDPVSGLTVAELASRPEAKGRVVDIGALEY